MALAVLHVLRGFFHCVARSACLAADDAEKIDGSNDAGYRADKRHDKADGVVARRLSAWAMSSTPLNSSRVQRICPMVSSIVDQRIDAGGPFASLADVGFIDKARFIDLGSEKAGGETWRSQVLHDDVEVNAAGLVDLAFAG